VVVVGVGVALLAAGCGGDDADGDETPVVARDQRTELSITQDRHPPNVFIHGEVQSAVGDCETGRRVEVFLRQPGADRLILKAMSEPEGSRAPWGSYLREAEAGWQVYARVPRAVRGNGFVCGGDRSPGYRITGTP
jgi:hypothetical protein